MACIHAWYAQSRTLFHWSCFGFDITSLAVLQLLEHCSIRSIYAHRLYHNAEDNLHLAISFRSRFLFIWWFEKLGQTAWDHPVKLTERTGCTFPPELNFYPMGTNQRRS